MKALTEQLIDLPLDRNALVRSEPQMRLRRIMRDWLEANGYRGYFIVGQGDINLASSRDESIGVVNLTREQDGFLERVRNGEALNSIPQLSDEPLVEETGEVIERLATMFVAASIEDDDASTLAILMFRLEPDRHFSPLFNVVSVGDSYAFDRKGLLLSESRFNAQLQKSGCCPAVSTQI